MSRQRAGALNRRGTIGQRFQTEIVRGAPPNDYLILKQPGPCEHRPSCSSAISRRASGPSLALPRSSRNGLKTGQWSRTKRARSACGRGQRH